jgi:hypothetical protein
MAEVDRSLKAVYVADLDRILATMKKIEPELQKEFRKELRKQIKPVERLAESFVPSQPFPGWRETKPYYPTNWGWAYDTEHRGRTYGKTNKSRWQWSQAEVKAGIQVTSAKTKVQRIKGTTFAVTALALVNKSVPGIIYELAGFGTARSRGKTRRVSRNRNASNDFIDWVLSQPTALWTIRPRGAWPSRETRRAWMACSTARRRRSASPRS